MPENKTEGSVEKLAVTTREACRLLGGISATSLWRIQRAGHLAPLPGLRMKLFSVKALKRYVEGGVES